MNETLKVIIESKTLTDLWAHPRENPENLPLPEKPNGTRHPKIVTMDDENIFKNKN